MSSQGCMAGRQLRKSGSTSIRFLNLDFIMSKDENAVSHVCRGKRNQTFLCNIDNFWILWHHKCGNVLVLKISRRRIMY